MRVWWRLACRTIRRPGWLTVAAVRLPFAAGSRIDPADRERLWFCGWLPTTGCAAARLVREGKPQIQQVTWAVEGG